MVVKENLETEARVHRGLVRAYTILGRLVMEIPTAELLSSAVDELAAAREGIGGVCSEAAEGMYRLCGSVHQPLVDIRADYARLFAGVRKLPAPPWESCYLSGKRQVCTEITESVRLAYLEAYLCQDPSDMQPDDHIGLELQFLGVMSKCIANALDAGDLSLVDEASTQRRRFVAEHISKWGLAFCCDLGKAAETEFYRALAGVIATLIHYEME